MATDARAPGRRRTRFEPAAVARLVRRATWLLLFGAGAVFFWRFGTERVPLGMNTVPSIPPDSWCIVDRGARAARVGSHVFVDVPQLGSLLSRVAAIDADTITVENPDPLAAWPDSRSFGPLPRRCLRSTVLVVFGPEPALAEVPRGR